MKAVVDDTQEILEGIREVVERLTSNPPPSLSMEPPPLPPKHQSRFDSEISGRYTLINTPFAGFQVVQNDQTKADEEGDSEDLEDDLSEDE